MCPCCRRYLSPELSRAFAYIDQNGDVLARELAEYTGIRHSAAGNRVRRLFDMGLVTRVRRQREAGGFVYVYNVKATR